MFNWLKSPLAENSNANEEDVLKTKINLQKLDSYMPQKEAGERTERLSKIPNQNLFDGIRKFQEKNGLKVDGIMKPNGETERTVIGQLKNKFNNNQKEGNRSIKRRS